MDKNSAPDLSTLEDRLKHGPQLSVFRVSVGILPAPEIVDFAGEVALVGHKALFREKLHRLRLGVKERLPANQGYAVTDRLTLPSKERCETLQKPVQYAKMEEAGVIGAITLAETASIPAGDTPQEGVKNGVSKNRLPERDSLNLPDKMRRRLPFAELFHTLDKALLVLLDWRREKIPVRGRQCRVDG